MLNVAAVLVVVLLPTTINAPPLVVTPLANSIEPVPAELASMMVRLAPSPRLNAVPFAAVIVLPFKSIVKALVLLTLKPSVPEVTSASKTMVSLAVAAEIASSSVLYVVEPILATASPNVTV